VNSPAPADCTGALFEPRNAARATQGE